jgi:hypothetical protein
MSRRFCRKWLVWLLPILVARAFLPVGFMLSGGPDGFELTFCPGQVSGLIRSAASQANAGHATQAGDHGAHAAQSDPAAAGTVGLHAHHHGGGQGTDERPDSPCPYGIAAVAMAADVAHSGPAAPELTPSIIAPRAVAFASTGPARADRIRGPPSLS